jgi:hypothetical protein
MIPNNYQIAYQPGGQMAAGLFFVSGYHSADPLGVQ